MNLDVSDYRILVVDDDPMFRKLVVTLLTRLGYRPSPARDGESASRLLADDEFDLLITDLKMPGVSGIDVIRFAKKIRPEMPVIILTGYASLESALEAIREDVYSYLTKPFQLDELRIAVGNAIERVAMQRENARLLADIGDAHRQLLAMEKELNACLLSLDEEASSPKRLVTVGSDIQRRQTLIEEGIDRLQSFQNRFLPDQYIREPDEQPVAPREMATLASLRERGVITGDEYDRLKTRIQEEA